MKSRVTENSSGSAGETFQRAWLHISIHLVTFPLSKAALMSDLSAIEPYVSAAADAFLGGGLALVCKRYCPEGVGKQMKMKI